jgi:hypothetical protein
MKQPVSGLITLSLCWAIALMCCGRSSGQQVQPSGRVNWSFVGSQFSVETPAGVRQWRLSSDSAREKLSRKIGTMTADWYGARAKSAGGAVVFVTCTGDSIPLQATDSVTTTSVSCADPSVGGGNGKISDLAGSAISKGNFSTADLKSSARAARVLQTAK